MVNFTVTRYDHDLALQIARRAEGLFRSSYARRDAMAYQMDVIATHANGCPLRLAALAGADDFNFAHDVLGIERHLDRSTGKLGGHFTPRFAA